MKRLKFLAVVLLVFLFASCFKGENAVVSSNLNEVQNEKNQSSDIAPDFVLQKSLNKEKGDYIKVSELSDADLEIDNKLSSSRNSQVIYLVSDYRYDLNKKHDLYLAVETANKTSFYKLEFTSYEDYFFICDVDGDKTDEIVLRQFVDSVGGAGQHFTAIYKVDDDALSEIFLAAPSGYDAGFSAELSNQGRIKLNIGYEVLINGAQGNIESDMETWEPVSLVYHSLFAFEPKDIDNDGVFEIYCSQLLTIITKEAPRGKLSYFLKFNVATQTFEVIDASFSYNKPDTNS